MTSLRSRAVNALISLAASQDYTERADAGRGLATFADVDKARDPLLKLIHDPDDTFVTVETTESLLRRHDRTGLEILAEAIEGADYDHSVHIHDAVCNVLSIYATERDAALATCRILGNDPRAVVRRGAIKLEALLSTITPVLTPHDPNRPL